MNNIYKYLAVALFGVAFSACENTAIEEDQIFGSQIEPQNISFSTTLAASNDDTQTRISINTDSDVWKLTWDSDDALGGYSTDMQSSQTSFEKFSISEIDDSEQQAIFTGTSQGSQLRLLYPYDDTEQSIASGVYRFDITSQTCDMSAPYANISKIMPLISKEGQSISDILADGVAMEHIGAVLDLQITFSNMLEGYQLLSVSVNGIDAYMPTSQDFNLSKSVSNSTAYSAIGTESISVDIQSSPTIKNDYQYIIPIVIMPFTVDSQESIDITLVLSNDVKRIVYNKSVKNEGSSVEFSRAEHHYLNVVLDHSVDSQGSGTEDDPFLILTKSDLEDLTNNVAAGNGYGSYYFKLMNDINLGGDANNQWLPIGNSTTPFQGSFDGNGYKIEGLYIDNSEDCQGLFGYIRSGEIKNLGIDGYVKGKSYIGGIAGYSESTITSCYNAGNISSSSSSSSSYSGGITGYSTATITSCHNTGNISSSSSYSYYTSSYSGGVAGYSISTITSCYNTGNISSSSIPSSSSNSTYTTSSSYSGGIVGRSTYTIISCYNIGDISSTSDSPSHSFSYSGGIVGSSIAIIISCYNTGYVYAVATPSYTSRSYSGGIVGNSSSSITSCYNTGGIYAYASGLSSSTYNTYSYSGGIAGYSGSTITSCYNIGEVSAAVSVTSTYIKAYSGGIAGGSGGSIMDCFYLDTSPDIDTTMKSADIISTLNSYAGDTYWEYDTSSVNDGYPILVGIEYE